MVIKKNVLDELISGRDPREVFATGGLDGLDAIEVLAQLVETLFRQVEPLVDPAAKRRDLNLNLREDLREEAGNISDQDQNLTTTK